MSPGAFTRFLFVPASVLVVAVIVVAITTHARADTVTLYATSCLGGWKNPEYATGTPSVRADEATDSFTDANSAVLVPNTLAQLYCGGFTGDVLENTIPTGVHVQFSWSAVFPSNVPTYEQSVTPGYDMPSDSSVPESIEPAGTEDVPSIEAAPRSDEPVELLQTEQEPTTEVAPEPSHALDTSDSVPPIVEPIAEPTSWLWHLVGTTVFAQEVADADAVPEDGTFADNTESVPSTDAHGTQSVETAPRVLSVAYEWYSDTVGSLFKVFSFVVLVVAMVGVLAWLVAYLWFGLLRLIRRMRKEAREAEEITTHAFSVLKRGVDRHIARLGQKKSARKLTEEELAFLEEFGDKLEEAQDVITKEIHDVLNHSVDREQSNT